MIELYKPQAYLELSKETKEAICNGCGSAGMGWLVPDNLFGCNITEACNIHDFMYEFGETIQDKEEADRVFHNNMIRLVLNKGGWIWLQRLRLKWASRYRDIVKDYGGPYYWDGKSSGSEIEKL